MRALVRSKEVNRPFWFIQTNTNKNPFFLCYRCGPCKLIGPYIDQLSEKYKDEVVIGKVNVDENTNLSIKFGVRSIPAPRTAVKITKPTVGNAPIMLPTCISRKISIMGIIKKIAIKMGKILTRIGVMSMLLIIMPI